jgi:hypothetical protein
MIWSMCILSANALMNPLREIDLHEAWETGSCLRPANVTLHLEDEMLAFVDAQGNPPYKRLVAQAL